MSFTDRTGRVWNSEDDAFEWYLSNGYAPGANSGVNNGPSNISTPSITSGAIPSTVAINTIYEGIIKPTTEPLINAGGDVIQGESARQNLEIAAVNTAVTASAVAGAYYGGSAASVLSSSKTSLSMIDENGNKNFTLKGLINSTANTVGGVIGTIIKTVTEVVSPTDKGGAGGANYQSGYYSDDPSNIYQGEGKSNFIIPVIIIGVVATTILIIKRKRK